MTASTSGLRGQLLAVLTCGGLLCAGQAGAQSAAAAEASAQTGDAPAQWVPAAPRQAGSDAVNQLVQACWEGNDHPRMSACVARTATLARTELQRTEAELRQRIQHTSGRSRAQRQHLLRSLKASARTHATYRQAMCAQRRALASLGNGEVDNGLACEAVLDRQRVQALQADAGYL